MSTILLAKHPFPRKRCRCRKQALNMWPRWSVKLEKRQGPCALKKTCWHSLSTCIELKDLGLVPQGEKGKKSEKSVLSDKALRLLENYAQLGSLFLLPRNDQLDDLANNGKLSDEQRSQLVTYDELVSLERRARYNLER